MVSQEHNEKSKSLYKISLKSSLWLQGFHSFWNRPISENSTRNLFVFALMSKIKQTIQFIYHATNQTAEVADRSPTSPRTIGTNTTFTSMSLAERSPKNPRTIGDGSVFLRWNSSKSTIDWSNSATDRRWNCFFFRANVRDRSARSCDRSATNLLR